MDRCLHSAAPRAECLRANGFRPPLSRSADRPGSGAGWGHTRDRECQRFRALEISPALYHFIVTRGHVPKIGELTAAVSRSQKTVRSALQRLADLHILVLQQNTSEVLRAAPFWAVPTAFHVQSAKRSWWASCVWDALAIPLMLSRDARSRDPSATSAVPIGQTSHELSLGALDVAIPAQLRNCLKTVCPDSLQRAVVAIVI